MQEWARGYTAEAGEHEAQIFFLFLSQRKLLAVMSCLDMCYELKGETSSQNALLDLCMSCSYCSLKVLFPKILSPYSQVTCWTITHRVVTDISAFGC